ncbi:hypothetical protein AVEN_164869-1 [Araneus ventricosus]|uniref:Uncharacterized protein n=1 Tax=Araneus ventricosus TaxID=182803 RepID=A0A4Y2ATF9_ARAVE|nr:hypothetical protein AVEN_164869-1 [Araneus ventricosus]
MLVWPLRLLSIIQSPTIDEAPSRASVPISGGLAANSRHFCRCALQKTYNVHKWHTAKVAAICNGHTRCQLLSRFVSSEMESFKFPEYLERFTSNESDFGWKSQSKEHVRGR